MATRRHRRMRAHRATTALLPALLCSAALASTQVRESSSGVRVLFDQAHHNRFAAVSTGYRPFVALLKDAGFEIMTNTQPLGQPQLSGADVVVIVNPLGAAEPTATTLVVSSSFSTSEMDAIDQWVTAGGSLLLVTDHYPTGAAAGPLAARFGVHLSGGWTDDVEHRRALPTYGPVFGHLVFSRENGLLGDHAITRGIDTFERVDSVVTFTGESVEGPADSTPLLRLGPAAADWRPAGDKNRPPVARQTNADRFHPCPTCDPHPAAGRHQAVALEHGRGRVVVVAEMGALADYNQRGTHNRQFTLNIVRWLARQLE